MKRQKKKPCKYEISYVKVTYKDGKLSSMTVKYSKAKASGK